MSIRDINSQAFIGQDDFSGGMNSINPSEKQCLEIRNGIIRTNKKITTRPGMRSYFKLAGGGFLVGFYFNQDNLKINDATHDGFWFPFDFVVNAIITNIQGIAILRLSTWDTNRTIFASNGQCYQYENGYTTIIPTTPAITTTESVNFVQMVNKIYMFRGEDLQPMVWDGADAGFILVADPITGSPIKNSVNGIFHSGRMWITNGDDVYASDIYDAETYDYVYASWGIGRQQEQAGVTLWPFHESGILCFKNKRISLLSGINANVLSGTKYSDYVVQISVDEHTGCIAPNSIVTNGEDVWYLGYNGINSILRNQESRIQVTPVATSTSVQNYINRINWQTANTSCAMAHDNYIIFGIPVDGALTPNVCLVYDKLMNAWAGIWDGALMNPLKFLKDNEVPLFLSASNVVRRMFTTDPWDSENPYSDTPEWDSTKTYQGNGELVYINDSGDEIYRSIQTSVGITPPNATYWTRETDVKNLYNITTYIKTRQYTWPEIKALIRFYRADILLRHRNPSVSLSVGSYDHNTDTTMYTDKLFPQEEYDVGGKADWDESNINLDFNDPHRKDYTILLTSVGIWLDASGLYTGIWETHTLPFIPVVASLQSIGAEITNTKGMIELNAVRFMTDPRRFSMFKTM